jgi:hypothetical protein
MYQKQKFKNFLNIFFKDFLYISLFISLFVVTVVTLTSERTNKLTLITIFYSSQFKPDRLFYDSKSLKSYDSQSFIILDIKSLIEAEKIKDTSLIFSHKSDIFFNINEKFNSEKINFKLEPKNILFNLDKQVITITLDKSYSVFNYKKITDKEIFSIIKIVEDEINKICINKELIIRNGTYFKSLEGSEKFFFLRILSSFIFLTIIVNLIFMTIKYKKRFF